MTPAPREQSPLQEMTKRYNHYQKLLALNAELLHAFETIYGIASSEGGARCLEFEDLIRRAKEAMPESSPS